MGTIKKGMKYAIVLGTRPEIIKISPIVKELEKQGLIHIIIHSGQHYSASMDADIFDDLNLPKPNYNLNVGSGSHRIQVRKIVKGLEDVFRHEKPDIVLVQGDTNTVLAGAIAASRLGIRIGHIEAGLRSYDRTMPEEINRVITDRISDYLFAPTLKSKGNLLKESIEEKKIYVTGNTVVDATLQNIGISKEKSDNAKSLIEKLDTPGYIFLTLHRPGNVDSEEQLQNLLREIAKIPRECGLGIIFPLHPRTRKMLSQYSLGTYFGENSRILTTDPIGYLDCLYLQSKAKLVMTDSGGLQEEACILGVPCITLRENTERPETLDVGSNTLVGKDYPRLLDIINESLKRGNHWVNPFGDGRAAERIIKATQNALYSAK